MSVDTPKKEEFTFSGETGEYFGIWFVNGLLIILTLGLYAPWAKVRKMTYFYSNTRLADNSFQFLATPMSIFKSHLIAGGLLVAFVVAEQFLGVYDAALVIYIAMFAVYLVVAPILLVSMMSFRLRNSAWRGIRFKFRRDYKWAYRVYLAPLVLFALLIASIVLPFYSAGSEESVALEQETTAEMRVYDNENAQPTVDEAMTPRIDKILFLPALIIGCLFVLLIPFFDFINIRFLALNSHFGTAKVIFLATAKDYYIVYSKWVCATIVLLIVWYAAIVFREALPNNSFFFLMILTMLYIPASRAYLKARRYTLLFDNLIIGDGHRLRANISFRSYFWLMMSNSVAIAISFGLLIAWAQIRTARYFLDRTYLLANGNLDNFSAAQLEEINALGEEISDAFGLETVL